MRWLFQYKMQIDIEEEVEDAIKNTKFTYCERCNKIIPNVVRNAINVHILETKKHLEVLEEFGGKFEATYDETYGMNLLKPADQKTWELLANEKVTEFRERTILEIFNIILYQFKT